MDTKELISKIEAQKLLMISVATGGAKIDDARIEYNNRRIKIRKGLAERKLTDPNPYSDLWRFHAYWSTKLPSWASRRAYVCELYDPLVDNLHSTIHSKQVFDNPTGWERVDRGINNAISILHRAESEEEYQAVGLICREVLISMSQEVFNPELHKCIDGKGPSASDAKRQLEAFVHYELSGSSNEEARAASIAAVRLSCSLQHMRTASFREAALCLEATNSVINFCAVLTGLRETQIRCNKAQEEIPF